MTSATAKKRWTSNTAASGFTSNRNAPAKAGAFSNQKTMTMELVEIKRVVDWDGNIYIIPAMLLDHFEQAVQRALAYGTQEEMDALQHSFGMYKVLNDQYPRLLMTKDDMVNFIKNR